MRTSVTSIATRKHLEISPIRLPERKRSLLCNASAVAAAAPADESGKDWQATLKLGLLFAVWYAANVYFNIYNKQVLKAFPYPMTCTAIQFGIGSLIACFMWLTGIMKRPKIEPGAFRAISPLACIHVLGNVLTNVSLRAVAPSFTHTVKAAEPLFSVILSSLFLGSQPTLPVVASLLPIVAGVVLASTSELSFNWTGFIAALGSNITFQSRNVLSKKFMLKGKAGLDNINLFSILTIMSFFILAPLAVVLEGVQLTPAAIQAFPPGVLFKGVVAGLTFHAYQQISYMILQRVTPVTHAVGNCVKRIVVIVASVIAFNTPVSGQNAFGTALAIAGVFLYSQAKRSGDKKELVHLPPLTSLQSGQGATQPQSTATVRINKCFREFASRREADRYVEDGRVMVNGVVAVSGQRVQPGDRITLDGREVQWEMLAAELARTTTATTDAVSGSSNNSVVSPANGSSSGGRDTTNGNTNPAAGDNEYEDDGSGRLPLEDRFYYIKYWKPRGVICTCDRSIRGNILDALPRPPPGVRLFTVGRLDKDSTGLILLTSDGRLPNASLRSKEGHPKIYRVTADRPIPDQDCQKLASGVVITTVAQRDRGVAKELTAPTLPCRLKRDGEGGRRLLIELREGRNRQIRRMLHALGYDTMELHRVSFMGIGLDGMWEGEWKPLNEQEMTVLRKAVRAAERTSNTAMSVAGEAEQQEDIEIQ